MNDLTIIEPEQQLLPLAPPGWERARLPELYKKMRAAMKNCLRLDECLEWKRRAEAFASYYRQAKDRTPQNIAERIRLRAYRRCGELFIKMDEEDTRSARATIPDWEWSAPPPGSTVTNGRRSIDTAASLGMASDERRRATALARLPEEAFEDEIAKDPPPSILALIRTGHPNYGQTSEQRAAASVVHALHRIHNADANSPRQNSL